MVAQKMTSPKKSFYDPLRTSARIDTREQFQDAKMSPTTSPIQPLWKGEQDLYLTLRFRLDQMEYSEYLSADSVDLVQRLLADLIQTTESARTFKTQVANARNEQMLAQEQVMPLRQELARLTSENNQLHKDLIAMSDERDKRERAIERNAHNLKSHASDLQFLSTQYAHKVDHEKKRADMTVSKVQDLFGRIGMAQDQPSGKAAKGNAEKIFQRLQKIDIETGLGITAIT